MHTVSSGIGCVLSAHTHLRLICLYFVHNFKSIRFQSYVESCYSIILLYVDFLFVNDLK